jgi:hypothetical protein
LRGDCLQYAVDFLHHIIVPKSHDAIAMIDEPFVAHLVALAVSVLTAIELDDQPFFATDEVDNVGPDRLLTDELVSVDGARTQTVPEAALHIGGVLPEQTGAFGLEIVRAAHAATPPHPDRFAA